MQNDVHMTEKEILEMADMKLAGQKSSDYNQWNQHIDTCLQCKKKIA